MKKVEKGLGHMAEETPDDMEDISHKLHEKVRQESGEIPMGVFWAGQPSKKKTRLQGIQPK